MSDTPADQVVLAIDQGTTNSKALLVGSDGRLVATGTASAGVSSPGPGRVEQDPDRIWTSVLEAVTACRRAAPRTEVIGVALTNQRESVVGWQSRTGRPLGPVIGWQDRRTADWCAEAFDDDGRRVVHERTGLRVDPMFSAPKMRWLLDHARAGVPLEDIRLGTIDSWLIWKLTSGRHHLSEAGNASRTLLYDIASLDWSKNLLDLFGIPAGTLPTVLASDAGFGATSGLPLVPDGTPIVAVLADSHAAMFGHGCTATGMVKATYGTGSSVMAPIDALATIESPVPTTLAWLTGASPVYALEGNVLSSGATLAWAAAVLTEGSVQRLIELAATVDDSDGVTLVPAFAGLGAPHWDRDAHAVLSGLSERTGRGHIARAAVESIGHQICDIVDVIERRTGALRLFRADGGVTASALVVQSQADLLGRDVQVSDVAEVSALGAAKLAWATLGHDASWPTGEGRTFTPALGDEDRRRRRQHWAGEIARTRYRPER